MEEKGTPLYKIILLFLSLYVLASIIIEYFFVQSPEIKKVIQFIDLIVCLIFLGDFLYCFFKAESKLKYMKWGWLDLISSIPAIDPLRWGRLAKAIRIIRYFRAIKSTKLLLKTLHSSKLETLTLSVFLVVFLTYSFSSILILEFEKDLNTTLNTAESALWWSFLNLLNAKSSISNAISHEGIIVSIVLNKVGLLLFAYLNSILISWLVFQKRASKTQES